MLTAFHEGGIGRIMLLHACILVSGPLVRLCRGCMVICGKDFVPCTIGNAM